jgi:hypothetical protein
MWDTCAESTVCSGLSCVAATSMVGHVMNVARRQFLQLVLRLAGSVAASPAEFWELASTVVAAPALPLRALVLKYVIDDKVLCPPSQGMSQRIFELDGRVNLQDPLSVLKMLRECDPEYDVPRDMSGRYLSRAKTPWDGGVITFQIGARWRLQDDGECLAQLPGFAGQIPFVSKG